MDYCGIKVVHRPSLKKDRVYPLCNIFGRYPQLLSEKALDTAADKRLEHEPSLENLEETGKLSIVYYKTELCARTNIKVLSLKTGHEYDTSAYLFSPFVLWIKKGETIFQPLPRK